MTDSTSPSSLPTTERVVRVIAETSIENEKYFGDLDAVVGDGDFGYSLARGFEKLLEGWDDLDRSNPGAFLKKSGMVITSRIGGTSGPIWGTGFMRAGMTAGTDETVSQEQLIAMLRAAVEGIKTRGGADLGDKTLLDSLVPYIDALEQGFSSGGDTAEVLDDAAKACRKAADDTADLVAKRGRASYTGERSKGSVDAGATALAVLAERLAAAWRS